MSHAWGVSSNVLVPDVAKQLIQFVTGSDALPVIGSKGIEPWRDN